MSGTYIRVGYDELDRSDRTRASNFINRSLVNNSKYKSRGQWRREWLRARVTTDNRYRRDFFFRESNRLFPCFPLVGTVTHLPRAIITFFSMGLFEHARLTASCLSTPWFVSFHLLLSPISSSPFRPILLFVSLVFCAAAIWVGQPDKETSMVCRRQLRQRRQEEGSGGGEGGRRWTSTLANGHWVNYADKVHHCAA